MLTILLLLEDDHAEKLNIKLYFHTNQIINHHNDNNNNNNNNDHNIQDIISYEQCTYIILDINISTIC